jgi:thiosulfate dehydrogenase
MRKMTIALCSLLFLGVAGYFAAIVLFLGKYRDRVPATEPRTLVFEPPRPEEAPPELRDAVMLGYNIMQDTPKYASAYVGNKLTCSNCHFQGGTLREGISLVGVAATYPKYRKRTNYATDLVARTNECFERSMNGRAAPVTSREMQALQTYFAWISRDIPIYSEVPWLGVKKITPKRPLDPKSGEVVYRARCAVCHGSDGQGTDQAPPLWGAKSFNDGAGMAKEPMFASFVFANMPKGSPDLTIDQAYDVAAYVATKPRPHFIPAK